MFSKVYCLHFYKEFNPTRNTIKFQNMIITRRNYLRGVIKSIEDEPMENHINEIIRLTKPKD